MFRMKQELATESWVCCLLWSVYPRTYLFRSTDTMARRGASKNNGESENSRIPRGEGNLCPAPAALTAFSLCLGSHVDASTHQDTHYRALSH